MLDCYMKNNIKNSIANCMLSMSVICTICYGKVFCSNNLNTQIYRKDNDTCTLNAYKIQNVQNNSGDNNMNAENVDNHSDIEWKCINGWWHYGPFEVFLQENNIYNIHKELRDMCESYKKLSGINTYTSMQNTHIKNEKIIINIEQIKNNSNDPDAKDRITDQEYSEDLNSTIDTEEYCECTNEYSDPGAACCELLIDNPNVSIQVLRTICNALSDGRFSGDTYEWICNHDIVTFYLKQHNIINKTVEKAKFSLQHPLLMAEYLQHLISLASK